MPKLTDAEKVKLYENFLNKLAEPALANPSPPDDPLEDGCTFCFCGNTDDAYEVGLKYGEDLQMYDVSVEALNTLHKAGVFVCDSEDVELHVQQCLLVSSDFFHFRMVVFEDVAKQYKYRSNTN